MLLLTQHIVCNLIDVSAIPPAFGDQVRYARYGHSVLFCNFRSRFELYQDLKHDFYLLIRVQVPSSSAPSSMIYRNRVLIFRWLDLVLSVARMRPSPSYSFAMSSYLGLAILHVACIMTPSSIIEKLPHIDGFLRQCPQWAIWQLIGLDLLIWVIIPEILWIENRLPWFLRLIRRWLWVEFIVNFEKFVHIQFKWLDFLLEILVGVKDASPKHR